MQQLHSTEKPSIKRIPTQYQYAKERERGQEKGNIPAELADGILACQALAGDERGFEQLVHRYDKPLFSYVYRFLGDREQANDVLQKVFLKFYLSLPKLRQDQPFNSWLFQVAYHYCIDEFRVRSRKPAIFFSELPSLVNECELSPVETFLDRDPSPEEVAENHELQQYLMQALLALPANYRAIVLLRYVAQLKFIEISQILDIPVATARTYFHRAKPRLRKTMEPILSRQ